MYVMKSDEVEDTPDVVISIFYIHSYPVIVLFNYDGIHSFVISSIVDNLRLVSSLRSPTISVTTLTGDFV